MSDIGWETAYPNGISHALFRYLPDVFFCWMLLDGFQVLTKAYGWEYYDHMIEDALVRRVASSWIYPTDGSKQPNGRPLTAPGTVRMVGGAVG